MPIYSTSRDVPLAPEQVFDFLSDPQNLAIWKYSGVDEVLPSPDGVGFGATTLYRFPGRHRYHALTCRLFHPPRLISFHGQRMWTPLGCQTPTFLFHLRPCAAGCTVTLQVRVRLGGAMGLLRPVVSLGWRRDLPEDARRLHEALAPIAAALAAREGAPAIDGHAAADVRRLAAGGETRRVSPGTAFA